MMIHIGIDIGKSKLDVCRSDPHTEPRTWPVAVIKFEDDDWHLKLTAIVPDGAIVVMEPTGWHYMKPVITALTPVNCTVWQVPTTTTGKIRDVHISNGKSDKMDARALALAATWIAENRTVKGAYPHSPAREEAAQNLRLLINRCTRETKSETRLLNQLDALGHSIWPVLAIKKDVWLKAMMHGATTPAELRALAARPDLADVGDYWHGNTRNALFRLVDAIPPYIVAAPTTVNTIRGLVDQIAVVRQQRATTEAEIAAFIDCPPLADLTQRWSQVPESSPLAIAALIVAVRGQPEAYNREEFKAAVGAHPRTSRSGETTTHNGKKSGYRPAMTAIWFWTMRLLSPQAQPNPVCDYHRELAARNHQHAFRASIAKLARVLHATAIHGDYRYGAAGTQQTYVTEQAF